MVQAAQIAHSFFFLNACPSVTSAYAKMKDEYAFSHNFLTYAPKMNGQGTSCCLEKIITKLLLHLNPCKNLKFHYPSQFH